MQISKIEYKRKISGNPEFNSVEITVEVVNPDNDASGEMMITAAKELCDNAAPGIGKAPTNGVQHALPPTVKTGDQIAPPPAVRRTATQQNGKFPPNPCPACGKTECVRKDKEKGNFYCWTKLKGCGHTWFKGAATQGETAYVPVADDTDDIPF